MTTANFGSLLEDARMGNEFRRELVTAAKAKRVAVLEPSEDAERKANAAELTLLDRLEHLRDVVENTDIDGLDPSTADYNAVASLATAARLLHEGALKSGVDSAVSWYATEVKALSRMVEAEDLLELMAPETYERTRVLADTLGMPWEQARLRAARGFMTDTGPLDIVECDALADEVLGLVEHWQDVAAHGNVSRVAAYAVRLMGRPHRMAEESDEVLLEIAVAAHVAQRSKYAGCLKDKVREAGEIAGAEIAIRFGALRDHLISPVDGRVDASPHSLRSALQNCSFELSFRTAIDPHAGVTAATARWRQGLSSDRPAQAQ